MAINAIQLTFGFLIICVFFLIGDAVGLWGKGITQQQDGNSQKGPIKTFLSLLISISLKCVSLQTVLCLLGFHLHRADRDTELSRKMWGCGICFHINEGWCMSQWSTIASTWNLLSLTASHLIHCGSPSIILVGMHIPPEACPHEAQQHIGDHVASMEQ